MSLRCGIVGLPNVGKSTLFNALTAARVPAENYPFCTTDPHVGAVAVPDPRLETLARLLAPERVVPAVIEFVDIAGLVRGAGRGEGMGNEFLDHIRNVDAIAHVVRCFEAPQITFHESVMGVDPARDVEIVEFELLQKDLEWTERRREKALKLLRTGDKSVKRELELYERMIARLNEEKPLADLELADEDQPVLKAMGPLTLKPVFYVGNLGEESAGRDSPHFQKLRALGEGRGRPVVGFFAKLESELGDLPEEDRAEFRSEMGLSEPGIMAVVKAGFKALNLVTFYTKVGTELRAWPAPEGVSASRAAGMIHSDFERGFIKAEVAGFAEFVEAGSEVRVRKLGLLRQEGKDYRIQDGDVAHFRFNVS